MSEEKRTFLDDIVDGARRLWEDVDQMLNPEKKKKRAKVPIPVRSRQDPRRDPRYPDDRD